MTEPAGRCPWCGDDPLYIAYHDREWGVPERDGLRLWEVLALECFQSGLSWITILRKRDGFRAAFEDFDPDRVACWGEADVARTLADPGVVRHRGKIEAAVAGARAVLEMGGPDAFATFVWDHVDGRPVQTRLRTLAEVPAETPVSAALARGLKARGFRYCGPTTAYAFMQAAGLVNDHLTGCPRHAAVAAMA